MNPLLLIAVLSIVACVCRAFPLLPPPPPAATIKARQASSSSSSSSSLLSSNTRVGRSHVAAIDRPSFSSPILLQLSSDSNRENSESDEPTRNKRRRKRVKRKDPASVVTVASSSVEEEQDEIVAQQETTTVPLSVSPDLKPRDNAPVELAIMDVRDVISGKSSFSSNSQGSSEEASSSNNVSSSFGGRDSSAGDSLQQLLADAKAMRQDNGDGSSSQGQDSSSISESVRNVLSTIVTVDFFVVCALLAWFLAGIFGSYVLKNDDVQIAFNSIFQQVVQPALGILMIGSAASAVLKEGDE